MKIEVILGALSLIAIGLAFWVARRIVYGTRVPLADPIYFTLRIINLKVLWIGWGALLVSLAGCMGALMFVVSVVIAWMVFYQHKVLSQRAHLALIAIAVEKQIPLPACVEAYAEEQGGRFAQRATSFADDLRSGTPLGAAIAESRGILPPLTEVAARVGQASGRMSAALGDTLLSQSQYAPIHRTVISRLLYFFLIFAFVPPILTFFCIKIIPAFTRIFEDFEVDLPTATILVIKVAAWEPLRWLGLLGFLLTIVVLVFASLSYVGVPWPLPSILSRLLIRFDRAAIQRALAIPAEQQRPLSPMIDLLAMYYPNWTIRNRLLAASERIEKGQAWIDCLRSQSLLGKADAAVLAAAERVGNLPWALREMAESNERRLTHRLDVLVQIASIMLVLVLGFVVLMVGVAIILPLAKLIYNLT